LKITEKRAAAEILASYGLAYDSGGAGNDTRRHEFITRRELLFMKSRKSQNNEKNHYCGI